MAIENATYIGDLNASNPPDGDPIGQGSNHLRLIKQALLNSFPNVKGPVTSSDEKLQNGAVPSGAIIMWSGDTVPDGWAKCDGGTYNKADGTGTVTVPDLRDKFLRGASDTVAVRSSGGANTRTTSVTVGDTTLTINQIPSHNHGVNDPGHAHVYDKATIGGILAAQGYSNFFSGYGVTATGYVGTNISIQYNGGNQPHNHTGTATFDNQPAYYAVFFIIRL